MNLRSKIPDGETKSNGCPSRATPLLHSPHVFGQACLTTEGAAYSSNQISQSYPTQSLHLAVPCTGSVQPAASTHCGLTRPSSELTWHALSSHANTSKTSPEFGCIQIDLRRNLIAELKDTIFQAKSTDPEPYRELDGNCIMPKED